MPSSIPAIGRILHVVGVGINRIGMVYASQELHSLPLYIDDTPALTISSVRTRARRLKRQHGLGLIIIDYLL